MEDEKRKNSAAFVRKPISVRDLRDQPYGSFQHGFEVEKIAEIPEAEFIRFSNELYEYYRFLYDNQSCMRMDPGDGPMHCILVTTPKYGRGILVEAEGYVYPRYAAFVPDCRKLDLAGKEVLAEVNMSPDLPRECWNHHGKAGQKTERSEGR